MSETTFSSPAAQPSQPAEEEQIPRTIGELQNIQPAYRLNGRNYLKWSQLVRTFLKGKGKMKHLLGTGPKKGEAGFEVWDEEDSMIMSWLWNSMTPEISDTCMFLPTAKAIWDALNQTYSKVHDAALIYEIKTKTGATKQGSKTVTEYANFLQNQWQELDYYRVIELKCTECAAVIKKFIERDRVYDLLAGLNTEFDQVRIQILGKTEVPSLNETISLIRAEESRRGVMLEPQSTDGSALAAAGNKQRGLTLEQPPNTEHGRAEVSKGAGRDELWCTYCKKPRHTKDRCWKLHGKPASREWGNKGGGMQQRQQGQAHMVSPATQDQTQGTRGFNNEEIERLRSLLGTLEKPSSGSCSLALSGKSPFSLALNVFDKVLVDSWILDSGATDHMTHTSKQFITYTPCPSNRKISIADGTTTTVAGVGDVNITPSLVLKNVLHVPKLTTNLVSIQKLAKDLHCHVTFYPSYCEFQDQGLGRRIGLAKEKDGLYYLETPKQPNMIKSNSSTSFLSSSNKDAIWLHHFRLGHPSFATLKIMFPSLFKGLDIKEFHCDICEYAKHTRVSFPISNKRCFSPFYLIHSDIWGPSTVPNISGSRWFVSFIDDCTRVTWIFLLKNKSEVSYVFPNFHTMVENQFGTKIKRVRTDNARDYFNQVLSPYFQKEGIIHESSCVKTPQQNGVAERKNRHILDSTRAFLFYHNVPKHYWGEAVLTSAHIINRIPSRVLDSKSPMEALSKFYPNLRVTTNLTRVFGCTSFVHVHNHNRGKLDPRAIKCVFVGYSSTQKGYKCFHPPTKKLFVSADVTFVEAKPYFTKSYLQGETSNTEDKDLDFLLELPSSSSPKSPTQATNSDFESTSPAPESPTQVTNSDSESTIPASFEPECPALASPESRSLVPSTQVPHKSPIRNTRVFDHFRFEQVYSRKKAPSSDPRQAQSTNPGPENEVTVSNPISTTDHQLPETRITDLDIPIAMRKGTRECTKRPLYPLSHFVTYKKFSPAHKSFLTSLNEVSIPNTLFEALSKAEWRKAMRVEMDALEKNRTWELVNLPEGKRAVGCKWVFSLKFKADGSLERHKARLVAKGYTQTYGVDYQETFAPVAKMNTVRILLSLAASFNWELQQYDVKNAFLHGDLEEEIYMSIPPGFGGVEQSKVCRLRKALYGLKQSPRAWFGRFTKVMLAIGYKQSQGDHTLFIKHSASGGVTVLIVYVDDIIVTGNDEKEKQALKQCLVEEFEIKDLGRLKYFLGIEVAHSRQGIFISQQKYVTDLLKETGMLGSKPIATPIEQNHRLGEAVEDRAVDKEMYQRLVGKLIYLSHTRPDIAYPVSVVSQFMHAPKEVHLQAVYRVLRYLKTYPGRGIMFKRKSELSLEAYTDADYAGSPVDRRSTTGYCTFLAGNLITWRSKKQNVVARSSAEAEFRAMAQGVCELLWLKIILEDLKVKWSGPMRLYCDNKAAISIAHNPVQHDRTKHIEVDRHFIKEKLESGLICTPYVPTGDQLADVLTKGLDNGTFQEIIGKLGIKDLYSPA